MTRRLAQQLVIAGCAALLLIVPLVPSSTPTEASQTPNSFHWGRKIPQFTVEVGSNLSGGWDERFRDAVSNWNANETVTMRTVSGGTNPENCSPSQGRVEVCNWNYGTNEGWLGLTRLFFDNSGDHVESATVQMNDSFFEQKNGQYNDESARMHTICHELGHSIGLDHVGNGSCMNDSQSAVFNNTTPISKDFNQLARIYDHKDSTTTVAGVQKKSKKDKKDKKKNRKRQSDRDRRRSRRADSESTDFFAPTSLPAVPSGLVGSETVTVQTLDNGQKMVSFITWAE